ncbi:amylo-alpha-1,6-glucosidase [Effusibacillus lacus]|uniref:Amylo-alpha-1,6-glucosidase n=1 Tax=Effusibacillus lacus TaxID=1348429 RepID=A0A292YM86_9BACL|nr:amylo-alpha-1,6-glucosidase [Effusibacillus lacus]TCS73604.1 glycogen debranching enzyme [Effusibacillus lacus]GAX89504.1 amylo-alpha-1,6-glucosidase [Effusibacillus lacus]
MNYRVIKEDDLFLVTDPLGSIKEGNEEGFGLFTKDTRFLSRFEVTVENLDMILLSSHAAENYISTIRLTNKEKYIGEEIGVWRESIEMERKRFIAEGVLYETVTFRNRNAYPVELEVAIRVDADFKDMFEVRGYRQGQGGTLHPVVTDRNSIRFSYSGSDRLERATVVRFDPAPKTISGKEAFYSLTVSPFGTEILELSVVPEINGHAPQPKDRGEAIHCLQQSYQQWDNECTQIETDNDTFNSLVNRSLKDIRVLLTDVGFGRFPVAGLPIYSVPFGRDSLIAALQLFSFNPEIARGTLKTMAAYQGTRVDPWRDEQPGKIMHEIRYGELANSGVIPFTPYYGTIDATPLFLVLAAEYYHWTGDEEFIRQLLPNIEQALDWIDSFGDRDSDGYVEYLQEADKGFANQGWKDSVDSVVHKNGSLAQPPIALAEVQGYVYDAKIRLAVLFERLGRPDKATELRESAARLKSNFARDFWMEEEGYVAIALDHEKKQVESVTSNPGHCLWSGLLTEEQARKVADRLLEPDMFSGWGIRTMSTESTGYNPVSYHNGSVWPHDNSICVLGLARYGFHDHANRVIEGLITASRHFEYDRLPELFCGYPKEEGYPIPYPVACSPQAWAAGTPLVFIRVMLGMEPDVPSGIVRLSPSLPRGIHRMTVRNMRVGGGTLDLLVQQTDDGQTTLKVVSNSTGLQVVAG